MLAACTTRTLARVGAAPSLLGAVMPVHGRAFSSVPIDWQSKGPDWQKRGRTQEELFIARAEGELLRSLRAEKAAEQAAEQGAQQGVRTTTNLPTKTAAQASWMPDDFLHIHSEYGREEPQQEYAPLPEGELGQSGSVAVDTMHTILASGVDGDSSLGLCSSAALAAEYKAYPELATVDEQVDSMIHWESGKGFASGFVTGSAGIFALPIALPAAIWASWTMQARLSGAIAELHGFDSANDEFTRTAVMMTLLDTWSPCPMAGPLDPEVKLTENKEASAFVSRKLAREFLFNARAPSTALLATVQQQIGKSIMQRAASKTAAKGVGRAVPLVSGVIGGTADAVALQFAGQSAHTIFGKIASARGYYSTRVEQEGAGLALAQTP